MATNKASQICGIILALGTLILAACGGETTENVTNINQMGVDVVSSVGDLPKCTGDNEGEQAFVKGETSARICVDGKWFATKESVSDTVVLAGDTVYMGTGDLSCTTKELADGSGLKIVCNGDSIGVVLNGAAGKDGVPGENGKDGIGTAGADGKDGVGCSLAQSGTKITITCGDKSATIDMGEGGGIVVDTATLDSEKIAISLDEVTGVSQKGPFLSGSKVLVKELEDGRSLSQTGNNFDGKILNDKGEFKITARMLVSQYVMLEATGYYRDEITGGVSPSTLTLFGITDVTTRSVVNINLLTHLEYERVIYLVTKKKMTVTAAKRQAQKEVFGLLDIDAEGFSSSEDLSIAGSSDEDGALLAFSVMFQANRTVAQLTELLTQIATDMEKDGTWDNSTAKMGIAEWAADADSSGQLAQIRNNVKNWNLSTMVPKFEPFVRHFWNKEYGLGDCTAERVNEVAAATAGKCAGSKTRYICKDTDGLGGYRWVIANDFEKDTYLWNDTTDGALKDGAVTGKAYVFDSTGSFNGTAGWREAESIEKQYGGCRVALYDSIRTDKVYAYYYTCKKTTHTWVREVDYLLIDTQYWPDSTDGKVKWGDSIGVATPGTRICYVWDEAPQYNGWRAGNTDDCNLGLLGCTAGRAGEMRESSNGRFYSCSNNTWVEITNDVYINTYLYRCTINEEGENVYKEGDLVYGIKKETTRYACDNEQWRDSKTSEEQIGMACTVKLQDKILGDTLTCDRGDWRPSIVFDFPEDKDWTNQELVYETLNDSRDGRRYKIIKINGITVMAQNLAYGDSAKSPYLKGGNWCYNNDTTNCLKGGRYYTWTAAMNIDSKWLNATVPTGMIKTPHQGICPEGWHIPTSSEWSSLFSGISYAAQQAVGNVGWKNATNASGFSALPIGILFHGFNQVGTRAYFWSATEDSLVYSGGGGGGRWGLDVGSAGPGQIDKDYGNAVRCFKDSE
ncbi:MAG: hypothetical protein II850_03820 [Fibrobacter sp.]|nr:hypothetical protein [Fibrobacter sp.]